MKSHGFHFSTSIHTSLFFQCVFMKPFAVSRTKVPVVIGIAARAIIVPVSFLMPQALSTLSPIVNVLSLTTSSGEVKLPFGKTPGKASR